MFRISLKLRTLSQKRMQKFVKKNQEYESILYNSTELSTDWTSKEFQNQIILFSRKIKSSI